jgi:hypothetical protein
MGLYEHNIGAEGENETFKISTFSMLKIVLLLWIAAARKMGFDRR